MNDGVEALLLNFPYGLLIMNGALQPVAASKKAFSVFGIRSRRRARASLKELNRALMDAGVTEALNSMVGWLKYPGDEQTLQWEIGDRIHKIAFSLLTEEEARYALIFEDITQQITSEEILLNTRRYLEEILENITLGVTVLGMELRVTSLNRQQEHFLNRMGAQTNLIEAVGTAIDDLFPDGSGAKWRDICAEGMKSGEIYQEPKVVHRTPDGELILSVAVIPLRDHRGRIIGVIQVSEDVTEKTRLEQELIRVEKLAAIGQMIVTVNHEINNPLSAIMANAQSLRLLNINLDDKAKQKLQKIEEQVRRIASVTERLRQLEEIKTDDYISDGPMMIDIGTVKE